MAEYRDIGYLNNDESTGARVPVDLLNRGQVYYATHKDNELLSKSERSFISFSWGDKNIEDFSFLVVSGGDRYQKSFYAPFQENTTTNDLMDGQKYWGFHYNANTISFGLATDGVLESTLQDFRNYFKPGVSRDLILSEYPNRAIAARVADAPVYTMLPFEEEVEKKIGNKTYKIKTTKWKGEASLNFVIDEPFWHNIVDYFTESFTSADELLEYTDEQLKIIEEDGIPCLEMFSSGFECFLSYNKYYSDGMFKINELGTSISSAEQKYLYNCGTGVAKPVLKFNFTPTWSETSNYIDFPNNSYVGGKYNTIRVGNKDFNFTTPGFLTSYNQAIDILSGFCSGDSIIELKTGFRDAINDTYIRVWATGLCELNTARTFNICDVDGVLMENFNDSFIEAFSSMFPPDFNINCSIDSETGVAEAEFDIKVMRVSVDNSNENTGISTKLTNAHIKENIGDMICSDYLIIDERTLPNANGSITPDDCLQITTDCDLNNLQIIYNYMYL